MTIQQTVDTALHTADAEQRLAEADAQFLTTFLALKGAARAARWRSLSDAEKQRLIVRRLEQLGYDWMPSDVAAQIAKCDAQYAVLDSDLRVPPTAEIVALAKERAETARRHGDWNGAAQLNRLRVNVDRGARLSWQLGDLMVQSVNNPGLVYAVNRAGCTCKNGQAGKAQCWHVAAYDLLLDMLATAAETADMEAEAAYEAAQRADVARRLCAARERLYCEAA
jgi:hypothetical protein